MDFKKSETFDEPYYRVKNFRIRNYKDQNHLLGKKFS